MSSPMTLSLRGDDRSTGGESEAEATQSTSGKQSKKRGVAKRKAGKAAAGQSPVGPATATPAAVKKAKTTEATPPQTNTPTPSRNAGGNTASMTPLNTGKQGQVPPPPPPRTDAGQTPTARGAQAAPAVVGVTDVPPTRGSAAEGSPNQHVDLDYGEEDPPSESSEEPDPRGKRHLATLESGYDYQARVKEQMVWRPASRDSSTAPTPKQTRQERADETESHRAEHTKTGETSRKDKGKGKAVTAHPRDSRRPEEADRAHERRGRDR